MARVLKTGRYLFYFILRENKNKHFNKIITPIFIIFLFCIQDIN